MRLTTIILIASLLQVSAATFGQKLTLQQNNIPLKQVFKEIRKQTGYDILYQPEKVNENQKVKAAFKDTPISEVLDQVLQSQSLQYTIKDKTIVITQKESSFLDKIIDRFDNIDIHGKVVDENGSPMVGATVSVIGGTSTKTDTNGEFYFKRLDEKATLRITYLGYRDIEIKARREISVQMQTVSSELQEVVVNKGYYTERKQLSTGNTSTLQAKDIQSQPVTNPLLALSGRVAGLDVTQGTGVAGSSVKLQLRGQNSLLNGSDPLFIIDGVPIATGNSNINSYGSVAAGNTFNTTGALSRQTTGYSPLATIDPNDIESVEILKDADATSIYGSRGANGVVLITTKRGKAGITSVNIDAYSGISKIARLPELLNSQQYIEMRKEAFKNDGVVPNANPGTAGYAPDLMLWDNNRYTDFQKLLIGGTAKTSNINAAISGGSANTQFLINTGFNNGTTVFPGDMGNKKYSLSLKLDNKSTDNKFFSSLTSFYTVNKNTSFAGDLSGIMLSPNAPALYDENGKLNWQENGVSFNNPLGQFLKSYKLDVNNINTNLVAGYHFIDNLTFKTSVGYNQINTNETSTVPFAAQDPSANPVASANFGKNTFTTVIVEPQLDYSLKFGKSKVSALVGGSYQYIEQNALTISSSGYSNDSFINSLSAATTINSRGNASSQYKYAALYGRVNYNYDNRYVINFSGRRDGSSRFGPNRQYSNFGAVGLAWVFTNEKFVKDALPFLSSGKLRGSYGVTGNDQIGNYQFLDTYQTANPYQGSTAIVPRALFNPDFSWERNKKTEAGLELGFLNDRINLSAAYYNNISGNQLVSYKLPSQTGFVSVVKNLDATIRNSGFEFNGQSTLISSQKVNWKMNFNLTVPKTKLTAFPGLAESSYASFYVIGQSPNLIYAYRSSGVDPASGVYAFEDVDKNGYFDSNDYQVNGNLDPKYFGGIGTSLSFGSLDLNVFLSFRKQMGSSYLAQAAFSTPGSFANQSTIVLDRWQSAGNNSPIQRYTASTSSDAYGAAINSYNSVLAYTDASFLRMKNISLGYDLTSLFPAKLNIKKVRLFVLGENLFTITGYKGGDPETQTLLTLPPLRTITAGIQINL